MCTAIRLPVIIYILHTYTDITYTLYIYIYIYTILLYLKRTAADIDAEKLFRNNFTVDGLRAENEMPNTYNNIT